MRYAATSNEQRLYDKVPMPPGLLVIGDAAQVVDPCYGQVRSQPSAQDMQRRMLVVLTQQDEGGLGCSSGQPVRLGFLHALHPCCPAPQSQGMSVVAMAAKTLGQEVSRALGGASTADARRAALRSLSATWQETLARSNKPAWLMATGAPLQHRLNALQQGWVRCSAVNMVCSHPAGPKPCPSLTDAGLLATLASRGRQRHEVSHRQDPRDVSSLAADDG